jgi:glutathione gamma-glutamylcysteinyltransferase
MAEGHCESFFTLIQQFITQSDVSTCSSASMAMMLNSLKVDPGVNWKGIWRWYDDYNIKQMHPSKIKDGLTLEEFNTLARLNGTNSVAFSPLDGP